MSDLLRNTNVKQERLRRRDLDYRPRMKKRQYNELVQQRILKAKRQGSWNVVEGFENLAGILMETACASLPQIPPRQKKHYLSEETWQKIEEKEIAINAGNWNVAKQLTIDIRKLARCDKERALLNEWNALIEMVTNGKV